jgi:hypothetical protein
MWGPLRVPVTQQVAGTYLMSCSGAALHAATQILSKIAEERGMQGGAKDGRLRSETSDSRSHSESSKRRMR